MMPGSSRQCNARGIFVQEDEPEERMLRAGHLYRYHGTFGFSRGVGEVVEESKARIRLAYRILKPRLADSPARGDLQPSRRGPGGRSTGQLSGRAAEFQAVLIESH
ncbi:hypothetical protein CMUS01_03948 [Colletotrichum musicola]|uniref:Uncharacterized protein n=1 Tax=Colletotrichum musicola TaxID=2175873 RepID=A0A8H6U4U6_9PEZI|nr:hypothetical protein CMUS01_03948 [Colletotrichum musicola]